MEAELHLLKRGKSFFGFYETMLGETSRVRWTRIVDTQVGVMPWMDLQGTVHNEEREYSAQSFMYCVKFHLLTVFSHDAAEHQNTTLAVTLKSLGRFHIGTFAIGLSSLISTYLICQD